MGLREKIEACVNEQLEDRLDELRDAGLDFLYEFNIDTDDVAAVAEFEREWMRACDAIEIASLDDE